MPDSKQSMPKDDEFQQEDVNEQETSGEDFDQGNVLDLRQAKVSSQTVPVHTDESTDTEVEYSEEENQAEPQRFVEVVDGDEEEYEEAYEEEHEEEYDHEDDYHLPTNEELVQQGAIAQAGGAAAAARYQPVAQSTKSTPDSHGGGSPGSGMNSQQVGIIAGIIAFVLIFFTILFFVFIGGGDDGSQDKALSGDVEQAAESEYQLAALELWEQHVNVSKNLGALAPQINSIDSFPAITVFLETEIPALRESSIEAGVLLPDDIYDRSHQYLVQFLETYKEYLELLQTTIAQESYEEFDGEQLDELSSLGRQAEILGQNYRDESDFIKSDIDGRLFGALLTNITTVVQRELDTIADEAQAEEDQRQAEEEAAQQLEENLAAVEQIADSFLNAYLSGNTTGARGLLHPTASYDTDVNNETSQGRVTGYTIESSIQAEGFETYTVVARVSYQKTTTSISEDLSEITETITSSNLEELTVVSFGENDWKIRVISFL